MKKDRATNVGSQCNFFSAFSSPAPKRFHVDLSWSVLFQFTDSSVLTRGSFGRLKRLRAARSRGAGIADSGHAKPNPLNHKIEQPAGSVWRSF
jgi:hypothetical protein